MNLTEKKKEKCVRGYVVCISYIINVLFFLCGEICTKIWILNSLQGLKVGLYKDC